VNTFERLVSWRKSCECNGTATTGRFISEVVEKHLDSWLIRMTYHPEPVCDVCHKPWVKEAN